MFGTETLGQTTALLSLSVFAALLWPNAAGNTASRFLAVALRHHRSDAAVNRLLGAATAVSCVVLAAVTVPVALAWGASPGTVFSGVAVVVGYGLYCHARGAQLGYHRAPKVALWDTVTSVVALALLVGACVARLEPFVLLPLAIGYAVFAIACWPRGNGVDGPAEPTTGVSRVRSVERARRRDHERVAPAHDDHGAGHGLRARGRCLRGGVHPRDARVDARSGARAGARSGLRAPDGRGTLRSRGATLLVVGFAAGTAVVFGLVALLAGWFLPIVYPGEGAAAVADLRYLMVGVWVFTVGLVPAALLLAAGRSRAVALASVAGFVVGAVLMVVLGPLLGVAGGSTGFLVGSAVNLVAVVALGLRRR